jgi:hypothetical protein
MKSGPWVHQFFEKSCYMSLPVLSERQNSMAGPFLGGLQHSRRPCSAFVIVETDAVCGHSKMSGGLLSVHALCFMLLHSVTWLISEGLPLPPSRSPAEGSKISRFSDPLVCSIGFLASRSAGPPLLFFSCLRNQKDPTLQRFWWFGLPRLQILGAIYLCIWG